MNELMKLYLEIRQKNPTLSDALIKQQASIYFFIKNSPFALTTEDKNFLQNLSSSAGINTELTYVEPVIIVPDETENSYVGNGYVSEYFQK